MPSTSPNLLPAKTARLPTAQRRLQLADAALVILSAEGSRALTVKRIAAEVGISDGAVFRHFANKQALFDAAIARFSSLLAPLPSATLPPIERLSTFFIARTTAVQQNPEILGLAMNDRLQEIVGEQGARQVQKQIKASFAFICQCLKDAQSAALLAPTLDVTMLAFMITGAMRGAARTGSDINKAWATVCDLLFGPTPHQREHETTKRKRARRQTMSRR